MLQKFVKFAEEFGFSVHEYKENDVLCGYELEKWTNGGVDMIHFLDCRDYPDGCTAANLVEELKKINANFDVDEQIDLHRQGEDYRNAFTCSQSVRDFEDYQNRLHQFTSYMAAKNWNPNIKNYTVRLTTSVEWTGTFQAESEEEAIAMADEAWCSGEDMYNFFDNQEDPELVSITIDVPKTVDEPCQDTASLVWFKDLLEDDSTPHFGLLLPDKNVLCLECGGVLEPEDYEILHDYQEIGVVDQVLQKHMWIPETEA